MALWALEQNAGLEWSTWYGDKNTSLKTCRLLKWSCFYLRQEQEFSRLVQTNLEVCLWHPETIKEHLSEVEKGVTGTDFWKRVQVDECLREVRSTLARVLPLFIIHICIFIYKGFKLTWREVRLSLAESYSSFSHNSYTIFFVNSFMKSYSYLDS